MNNNINKGFISMVIINKAFVDKINRIEKSIMENNYSAEIETT